MLLIDCGNSALKCRLIEAGAVKDSVFDLRDQRGRQGRQDQTSGKETYCQAHRTTSAGQVFCGNARPLAPASRT